MNHVIATSRAWNEPLASRLQQKIGQRFHLITREQDLSEKRLRALSPRYVFLPHWSHIIPPDIYTNFECVVFHMTDLPYGRGGSPLQNLIELGHRQTMISAFRCTAEVDGGPIYLKRPLTLEGSASEIFLRAAEIIETMIETVIHEQPEPQPQRGEVTKFRRRGPRQSAIRDAQIADLGDFFDFIRMLDADGYPRAFIELHGHKIELSRVQREPEQLVGMFVIHSKHEKSI